MVESAAGLLSILLKKKTVVKITDGCYLPDEVKEDGGAERTALCKSDRDIEDISTCLCQSVCRTK